MGEPLLVTPSTSAAPPPFRVGYLLAFPAIALILALDLNDCVLPITTLGDHTRTVFVSFKGIVGWVSLGLYGLWLVRELRRTIPPARLCEGVGLILRGLFLAAATLTNLGLFVKMMTAPNRNPQNPLVVQLILYTEFALLGFFVLGVSWFLLVQRVQRFEQAGKLLTP